MSTRAVIIRKAPGKNELQFGQTKNDGYNNTATLNKYWQEPEKVDALFDKLVGQDKGIYSLGKDMEATDWYEDGYNCGERQVEVWTSYNYPEPYKAIKFINESFDWAEYVSVYFNDKWYDFNTDDLNSFKVLAHMLTQMQNEKYHNRLHPERLNPHYITEYR